MLPLVPPKFSGVGAGQDQVFEHLFQLILKIGLGVAAMNQKKKER